MDAAAIKAFFEDVASDWGHDAPRVQRRARHRAARRPHPAHRRRDSVDVGTGTGFVAAGLAPHAERVLGFDNAAGMLDVARKNLDSLAITNVELAEADALPLPDDAADAAVANMVRHHAQDLAAMIAEMGTRHTPRR
jgi:ubiquinone/menaquinone biosynthesis C-methylase UbiE